MCKYAGGKKRIAKELHDVMIQVENELVGRKMPYLEPFCGMLSVCKEFDDGRRRIASDINEDVILMWDAVLNKKWRPPTLNISRAKYDKLRLSDVPSAERGFYGSSCCFGGYFFRGFRKARGDNETTYWNKILSMKPRLENVSIKLKSYDTYKPKGNLIYCDPPYVSTQVSCKYNNQTFDNDKFWNIMRQWSKNNLVFISEESAPRDFVCVWSKNVPRHSNRYLKKRSYERLFIHRSYLE